MQLNIDQLVKLSDTWLPLLLNYAGKMTLALVTLLGGWWLINTLTDKVGHLLSQREVDPALHGFVRSLASMSLKVLLLISVA